MNRSDKSLKTIRPACFIRHSCSWYRKRLHSWSTKEKNGELFCGGALISPTHVITSSRCTVNDIRWASIGAHNVTGSKSGEHIKVLSVMNHPTFSANIELAMISPESNATALGWGLPAKVVASKELLRVKLPLISDEECEQVAKMDKTMLCAGGVISEDVCKGDTGGPLVLEAAGKMEKMCSLV
ncbi:putative serine protease, trypsin domain, peptidase S1A, chymotrypsin family, peptidase S1, PA clan [Plasmopara halstedii]